MKGGELIMRLEADGSQAAAPSPLLPKLAHRHHLPQPLRKEPGAIPLNNPTPPPSNPPKRPMGIIKTPMGTIFDSPPVV